MMRRMILGVLVMGLMWGGQVGAQEQNSQSNPFVAYREALEQIAKAPMTGFLSLDLRYGFFTTLAPQISKLKNLQQLYLFNFSESTLPIEIGQFTDSPYAPPIK